jgi:N-sulfoglucosamine sulfohydrolase
MTSKRWILRFAVGLLLVLGAEQTQAQRDRVGNSERPNIVWIIAEDLSPFHLGAYGNAVARTSHIDRLAAQGRRYTNAFALNGACAPNRSSLVTGLYPTSYGAHHMRTMRRTAALDSIEDPELLAIPTYEAVPPPEARFVTEYLRTRGYYATNNGKTDYQFATPATAWDENYSDAHWQHRPDSDQPFFSVFNFMDSHESRVWVNAHEPLRTDPDSVDVPPYYPDTPIVRRDIARNYDNIARVDEEVGHIMDQLRADGLLDETIVFFFGDHGSGLPRMKRTVYDSGIRVPLIVRFPEGMGPEGHEPGMSTDRLVSFVDFAPTLLSLAGVEVPDYMAGRPFLGPQAGSPRDYVFASRDRMDPARHTRRAVSDGRFKYIRNYRPERPFLQFLPYRNRMDLMQEILRAKEEGRLDSSRHWQWLAESMPMQEFYDTRADPHEINNLVGKGRYADKLAELRRAEQRWRRRTDDMGLIPEPVLKNILWPPRGKQPRVEAPTIQADPAGNGRQEVRLRSATVGASIAYKTVSGQSWQVYQDALRLSPDDTLRAKAVRMGFEDSKTITWKGRGK